ncbi:MAG: hypothetical protein HOV68_02255, partial [Streptomycetaceae bacterium]|nr:hypothetical protein [Streptomycetaceae bacterium]
PHRHRADPRAGQGLRRGAVVDPRPGPARAFLTLLALGYLALVAYTAGDTFYVNGPFSDTRIAWILPPVVLFVAIEAALQSRHWHGRPEFPDLPPQLLATAVTTTSGAMYADNHHPHTNLAVLVTLVATAAALGQSVLIATTQRWLGQVTYVRERANA